MGSVAKKHGIKDISLHAHGDVPSAVAMFLKTASQYDVDIVRGDIVHRGSGLLWKKILINLLRFNTKFV